jgi:hypothetical protein
MTAKRTEQFLGAVGREDNAQGHSQQKTPQLKLAVQNPIPFNGLAK